MSTHTPGPWEVQRYLVNERDEEVSSMARGNLKVRLRVVADDSPMVVADMVAGSPSDAHLIAAAPELLAALIDAFEFHRPECASLEFTPEPPLNDCDCGFSRAHALLAKVEGR